MAVNTGGKAHDGRAGDKAVITVGRLGLWVKSGIWLEISGSLVYRLLSVIVNDHDIVRAPMRCGAPYVFHLLEKALQD